MGTVPPCRHHGPPPAGARLVVSSLQLRRVSVPQLLSLTTFRRTVALIRRDREFTNRNIIVQSGSNGSWNGATCKRRKPWFGGRRYTFSRRENRFETSPNRQNGAPRRAVRSVSYHGTVGRQLSSCLSQLLIFSTFHTPVKITNWAHYPCTLRSLISNSALYSCNLYRTTSCRNLATTVIVNALDPMTFRGPVDHAHVPAVYL